MANAGGSPAGMDFSVRSADADCTNLTAEEQAAA